MNRFKFRLGVDSLILGVASVTLATSIFFLFQDGYLFSDASTANLTPVGTFKTSNNDVRRRVDSGLTWSNIDAPDIVYEGDSIFTGDSSDASITLDNGNILKIDPKSLVVIRTRGNGLEIDLQYGSLQGKITGTQPIVISQNGRTQEIGGASGSELRIVKQEAAKPVRVQTTRGQLSVKDTGSQAPAKVVKLNEVLQVREKEDSIVETSSITLNAPNGQTVWLPMGAPLAFKWEASGAAASKALRIELSRNLNFATTFYQGEVRGGKFSLPSEKRPEGAFYWRIKPAGESPSLPAFATAYSDLPPVPVLPLDQHTYFIDTEKGETSKSVFFTWEDKVGSVDFQVQVAKDEAFSNIVATKSGKEKIARVQDLAAGTYHWRVMGRNLLRTSPPYSRMMTFSIKESSKAPKAPVMAEAEINYVIPQKVLSRVPASVVEQGRGVKPVGMTPFTWSPDENAKTYEVEVAVDSSFANSVKHEVGDATSFTPQEVRPGELYLRVRGKGADGRASPLSEPTKLTVSLPPPVMKKVKPVVKTFKSQKDADSAPTEFKFAWSPQSFADSYELQWGSDVSFERSKKFRVKDAERSMKVTKPADYAVRVRSLAADGSPISPYSIVQIATLKKEVVVPKPVAIPVVELPRVPAALPEKPPVPTVAAAAPEAQKNLGPGLGGLVSTIPTPKLREPQPETALISLEAAPTFVTFRWAPFKGAKFYTIQIAEDADFTKVVSEKKVNKNTFLFEKELPEGRVFWRVRAHNSKGYSEWSDPSDLKVIYQ